MIYDNKNSVVFITSSSSEFQFARLVETPDYVSDEVNIGAIYRFKHGMICNGIYSSSSFNTPQCWDLIIKPNIAHPGRGFLRTHLRTSKTIVPLEVLSYEITYMKTSEIVDTKIGTTKTSTTYTKSKVNIVKALCSGEDIMEIAYIVLSDFIETVVEIKEE